MTNATRLLLLTSLGWLAGCASWGYQRNPPPSSLWKPPAADAGESQLSAYLYQPSPDQIASLKAAAIVVAGLFRDEEFRALVRQHGDWLAHAEGCEPGEQPGSGLRLSGEQVVAEVLDRHFEGVHYLVNSVFGGIAKTDIGCTWTAIKPWQIAKWSSPDASVRAELINTLMHELTHLVPETKPPDVGGFRFSDKGHDDCTDGFLVSYRLGNLAGCYYKLREAQQHPSKPGWPAAFSACMRSAWKLPNAAAEDRCAEKRQELLESCGE